MLGKKSKELQVVETEGKAITVPADMISLAISKGADLDKLEKLLTLQERWEANEAKKAYNMAMSEFKANPPKINKDKDVSFTTTKGKTSYSHASLANVTDKISQELSKHGLSASWMTKQEGNVAVTCKITHSKGHSEETTLSAPSDVSGSKNPIQAIGSTVTYLERYTLLALTGLATYDMDDDGRSYDDKKGGESKPVNEEKTEMTIRQQVASLAKTRFNNPDDYKVWRTDHNLVEVLKDATDKGLQEILDKLKEERC